jgi:hypothetical protein
MKTPAEETDTEEKDLYLLGQRFILHLFLSSKRGHFLPPLPGCITILRLRDLRPLPHVLLQPVQGPQGLTTQSTFTEKKTRGVTSQKVLLTCYYYKSEI